MEVRFELLLAAHPERVLGTAVAERFRRDVPGRFDYLDAMESGHLSVQCHPGEAMRAGDVRPRLHAGGDVLRDGDDTRRLHVPRAARGRRRRRVPREAEAPSPRASRSIRIATCVRHPAQRHRLYLIPPGTPHASGRSNAVLEISATPYLYTLLLRLASSRRRRTAPSSSRRPRLREPRPQSKRAASRNWFLPRRVRDGHGWRELLLGRHPGSSSPCTVSTSPTRSRTTRRVASTSSTSSRTSASRSRPRPGR